MAAFPIPRNFGQNAACFIHLKCYNHTNISTGGICHDKALHP